MSTAELRKFVDQCSATERAWLREYLFTKGGAVPELKVSKREAAELARRAADIAAGRNCVRFKNAEELDAWIDRGKP